MIDIWIAVGIGILTALMALLGVLVTLHPPTTNTQKNGWKAAFVIIALLACALVYLQSKRSEDSQAALQAQIGSLGDQLRSLQSGNTVIQQELAHPPSITVKAAPPVPEKAVVSLKSVTGDFQKPGPQGMYEGPMFVAGWPIGLNLVFKNVGKARAEETKAFAKAYVAPNHSEQTQNQLIDKFKTESAEKLPLRPSTSIDADGGLWITGKSDSVLSPSQIQQLLNGDLTVFLFAKTEWSDPAGSHHQTYCQWLQQPVQSGGEEIWDLCGNFSDRK